MKGNVIGFDPDSNTGAISGYDGNRYDFAAFDWHSPSRPQRGDLVDFVPEEQRAARIYLIEPEYVQPGFFAFYLSPSGRIARAQYWLRFVLPVVVVTLVLQVVGAIDGSLKFLATVFQLIVLWPGIAVLVKRIHDRNKSGWLVLLLYAPAIVATIITVAAIVASAATDHGAAAALWVIAGLSWVSVAAVGIWFFIEFGCLRGTIGPNRYGPDPVGRS